LIRDFLIPELLLVNGDAVMVMVMAVVVDEGFRERVVLHWFSVFFGSCFFLDEL